MADGYVNDVFISYARDDDEPFVRRLFSDLVRLGFEVWWDREAMPSRSLAFAQEIRDAIDESARLVAVIGPSAVNSEYVRAEWGWAQLFGSGVIPVLRLGDFELLPEDFSRVHTVDMRSDGRYAVALDELSRHLAEPVTTIAPIVGVPALPPHFVSRGADLRRLRELVLADVRGPTVVTAAEQTSALQGMGGVGKSVLAAALARSIETRRAFHDGVVWISVGQSSDDLRNLRAAGSLLGTSDLYVGLAEAKAQLSLDLQGRSMLIVLDDVWSIRNVEPFANALDTRCRLLITTRDGGLVEALGAQQLPVDLLAPVEAVRFLADWAGLDAAAAPQAATEIAEECGYLPFALALAGAMARGGTPLDDLLEALREADLAFLTQQLPNYPYADVLRAFSVSVDALSNSDPKTADLYRRLAVFKAAESLPEAAVSVLWDEDGSNARNARSRIAQLSSKALLTAEGKAPNRQLSLHDLQLDFLRATADDLVGLHRDFVEEYRARSRGGWHIGPDDGYFFGHICYHMAEAELWTDLAYLLLDQRFIRAKTDVKGPFDLYRDYKWRSQCLAALERPEDRELLRKLEHTASTLSGFVMRPELALIERAVHGNGATHTFVVGPGGIGKTTLLAYVWLRNFRTCVLIDDDERTTRSQPFADWAITEAARAAALVNQQTANSDWSEDSGVGSALGRPRIRCVIIDGHDHQGEASHHLSDAFPEDTRFLWASRTRPDLTMSVGSGEDAEVVDLAPWAPETVRTLLRERTALDAEEVIDQLISLTQGNPFTTRLIVDGLQTGSLTVDQILDADPLRNYLSNRVIPRLVDRGITEGFLRELTRRLSTDRGDRLMVPWDEIERFSPSSGTEVLNVLRESALFLTENRQGRVYVQFSNDKLLDLMRDRYGREIT